MGVTFLARSDAKRWRQCAPGPVIPRFWKMRR
jgi:hypothetical protein